MSWHERRLVLFDLETTGVDPHRDRIVTAALIYAGGGQPTETHTWLLEPDPDVPISAGAAEIHGITLEHAREHGTNRTAGIVEITERLIEAKHAGTPIVGHNVTYDLTMQLCETTRHGDEFHALEMRSIAPVIDTLVLDKWADKYRKGSRKLVDVAKHYGVALTDADAHGAEADALAAGRIAWHIARKYPGCQGPAREVHAWLVDEKREQAESFGAYLVRQGKKDDVAREWPIQEFPPGWNPMQTPAPADEEGAA